MPHNDFGTSHFPFTHYGHLKIKRTPVSPHGSKCEHLWQESVRPDFYSQWQRGAVWPAAELKIVPSGLARHTRTKKKSPLLKQAHKFGTHSASAVTLKWIC